ncbi:MAG: hypothetical protein JW741_08070 [Sedimentisphaerales bacterium]|nr:hypothetical protein [Sedimentisphaerales bacterium]
MSVAIQQGAANRVTRNRTTALSTTRSARSSRGASVLSAAQGRRRDEALRRRRIRATRRLVAAGNYDSEEVLDAVLDMVIEDLTS